MPSQCFYHSADLDGHCSGAIVKAMYENCQMTGINYGQAFPFEAVEKEPGQEIYMVDFTLQPFEDMERLDKLCKLIWIDHHKTAIDEAHKRRFLANGGQLLEVGEAACELTWKWFHPNEIMPVAVHLLGRYDVWDHSDPNTLAFQWGMRQFENTLPDNQDFWRDFISPDYDTSFVSKMTEMGRLILKYQQSENAKRCKAYAFETVLYLGHKEDASWPTHQFNAICINLGMTNSQIFDSVWDSAKYDLMITFCRLKPPAHKWTVSLYSTKPEIDCGTIAKSFGGGGHNGAAGFQCEHLPFEY